MIRSLIILIALLTGCTSEPQYPLRSHELAPVDVRELPQGDAIAPEASAARWRASSARLSDDVPRAVKRADWGLLELSASMKPAQGNSGGPMRAEAMLADNRLAVIHVWAISENEVAAAVMVGRFGDAKMQEYFLQMLADTLADKPKPKRGGTFELP